MERDGHYRKELTNALRKKFYSSDTTVYPIVRSEETQRQKWKLIVDRYFGKYDDFYSDCNEFIDALIQEKGFTSTKKPQSKFLKYTLSKQLNEVRKMFEHKEQNRVANKMGYRYFGLAARGIHVDKDVHSTIKDFLKVKSGRPTNKTRRRRTKNRTQTLKILD